MNGISDQELLDLQRQFPSALNYLTSIYIINREYGKVGNSRLASRLKVSKPAANQAMGRLKKLGLTEQVPYESIRLTPEGRRFAEAVLIRHYLIEHLLISKLEYPWEKSDEEAQRLQASLSEDFTEYLYNFFGQPKTCPHGNPFPGTDGEEELVRAKRLMEAPVESDLKLIRITEEGESQDGLLPYCHKMNLYPGKKLFLVKKDEEAVTVMMDETEILIPRDIAAYLCYRQL
ncbi:metal-dependent transcriptional regulator [Oceanispirochaeta sp.]|jgi:DtxR family Mn-dependent transcriptional regulator|uniref:metal-dependent transcriptional regulator n=1 Tax=Oceanispirochaeta sp. TaxID=2035350 RepID=UPI00261FB1E6|nr:metal-dependent transcriptional regulator [Oceanispirochaeta sp.]MDA3957256.1 metal-dependent transcriptional regulator [Oceanispirochaeta sp.]